MRRAQTAIAAEMLALLAKHVVPALEAWGHELRRIAEGQPHERPQPEPLLKTAEAARYLQVSTSLLQDLVARKLIPHVRLGRESVRFCRDVLAEWTKAGGLNRVPPKLVERDAKRAAERSA